MTGLFSCYMATRPRTYTAGKKNPKRKKVMDLCWVAPRVSAPLSSSRVLSDFSYFYCLSAFLVGVNLLLQSRSAIVLADVIDTLCFCKLLVFSKLTENRIILLIGFCTGMQTCRKPPPATSSSLLPTPRSSLIGCLMQVYGLFFKSLTKLENEWALSFNEVTVR